MDQKFSTWLDKFTEAADSYLAYSPTQITRGDHLKNDPTLGEHSWRIPETTGMFLHQIIRRLGLKIGLELGTSTGYSTFWISHALYQNDVNFKLMTIERVERKHLIVVELFKDIPFGKNIAFMKSEIAPTLEKVSGPFDFIFMDADRGNYVEYWNYIKKFLNKKSIVIIDNALRVQKSVTDFQDFLKSDPSLSTYLHPLDNGLFIVTSSDSNYLDLQDIIDDLNKKNTD